VTVLSGLDAAPVGPSGISREGGEKSLDAYLITKAVLQRIAPV
jgi:hypothetical protein